MVHATLRVPQGNVKELVMELLFMCLDILRMEDKTVCFIHLNDPNQQAKKHQDMPPKFQKIHKEWMVFKQSITCFKNNIKEGRRRTYNVSFWLGSKQPPQKILDSYILKWDKTCSNKGIIKMVYKLVQSLYTSNNLILVGVPTDLDADALHLLLKGKMEEARQEMVAKNPCKYGSITKVPDFVIERDFIKHTPYTEQSDDDNIPFWAKVPFYLEYLSINEDMHEHILAFMYQTKHFQDLFGKVTFYHQNLGFDSTAGEHKILTGVPMRHIVMVRLTGRVILKGLTKPDHLHILQ